MLRCGIFSFAFLILLLVDGNLSKPANVGIPGGIQEIDVNDPKIQELKELVLGKYRKDYLEEASEPIIVDITKVSRQIVAGTLYRMELILAASTCKKGENVGCTELEDKKRHKCSATGLDPLQKGPINVEAFECSLE